MFLIQKKIGRDQLFLIGRAFFFALGLFLLASKPVFTQDAQPDSIEKKIEQADSNHTISESMEVSPGVTPSSNSEKRAQPLAVEDESFLASASEIEKAMDQALQESMAAQAKAYYPMIREMSFEANDERAILEISYDAASENDLVSVKSEINKADMFAQIQILSPLLQKSESMEMQGDSMFIQGIQFLANPSLTGMIGKDTNLVFLQKIHFKLLRPVRLNVSRLPGLIRIELWSVQAEDAVEKKKTEAQQDIVFEPQMPQTTAEVLGQSFQNQREYEENINFGGEVTLLEGLNEELQSKTESSMTNYQLGVSADAVRADSLYRYPAFGSIDYWKKHLTGALQNTTRLLKRERNQHMILNETPQFAIKFDRKGPVRLNLGYNYQREFPFFYAKLGRQAPIDGLMRQDIQGGAIFTTQSPWTFSVQNRLGIATSENLRASSKFGDRINDYRYEAGQSIRYKLKRGFVQLGAGMKFETQEIDIRDRDIESYLSLIWFRRLAKRLSGKIEYDYKHEFFQEGEPQIDMNVHRIRAGLQYQPNKSLSFKPDFGMAFFDGEAFMGIVGSMDSSYDLTRRDSILLSYKTDFIRSEETSFGSESLNRRRTTSEARGDLIRYHVISAAYDRQLSKRLQLTIKGALRSEVPIATEPKDRFLEYTLSLGLKRQISDRWTLDMRYALSYLSSYHWSFNGLGGATKLDEGNTTHEVSLRMQRYFGKAN